MRILVSGATKTVHALATEHRSRLGTLATAKDFNSLRRSVCAGLYYAIDNSAFTGLDLDGLWRRMCDAWELMEFCPPEWLVAPDVVCDPVGTLSQFNAWYDNVEYEIGYQPVPLAYALQDGQKAEDVPWDRIAGVFVGGSTEYKYSDEARKLCATAKRQGLLVHCGRVNTLERLWYARDVLQADTVDGSGFSRWPSRIEWACRKLRADEQQLRLFAA